MSAMCDGLEPQLTNQEPEEANMGKKRCNGIGDNALKASLRTPLFKQQIVKSRKGKGSYTRKGRGRGRGYAQAA